MALLQAHGIQRAVEIVQREIDRKRWGDLDLSINLRSPLGAGDDARRGIMIDEVVWWGRFVTLLQQSSNAITLASLRFYNGSFDNRPEYDEAFTRLFQDVLPTLGPKIHIEFKTCKILPVYIDNIAQLHNLVALSLRSIDSTTCELILKALDGNTCLEELDLWHNKISADAIAQLLLRSKNKNGPPIQTLVLSRCSIDSPSCEIILKALDGNQCLQCLRLPHNVIYEISLEAAKALGHCKTLFVLDFRGNSLSVQSWCHLAEGLRTTLSLRHLWVNRDSFDEDGSLVLDAFAELLKTFTYAELCCFQPPGRPHYRGPASTRGMQLVSELNRHNRTILTLHEKLFQSEESGTSTPTSSYQLQQLDLWPLVLKCIGSKPSLIYHFVRHGNLESFRDQVLQASSGK